MTHRRPDDIAARLLGQPLAAMDAGTRKVARHVAARQHIARNIAAEAEPQPGLGQRAADRVAAFGGSWIFVGLFAGVVLAWVVVNGLLVQQRGQAFDPYPYILLNLFLSMLAAIQAPVILTQPPLAAPGPPPSIRACVGRFRRGWATEISCRPGTTIATQACQPPQGASP